MIAFARRYWQDLLVGAGTMAVIVWILWPHLLAIRQQPAAQRELVAFTSELRLGMSGDDVRARLRARRTSLLIGRQFGNTLQVDTPGGFVNNWIATLDFVDGRLSSIRIRTADGMHDKPDGSPPDVGVAPPRR